MLHEAQHDSHDFHRILLAGISSDAVWGKSGTYNRVVPALNFQLQTLLSDRGHFSVSNFVLVRKVSLPNYLPPKTGRLADNYAPASRPFLTFGEARQNTFNSNSPVSIAPATAQNSICSSERGIASSSFVMRRGNASWGKAYQWRGAAPAKSSRRLRREFSIIESFATSRKGGKWFPGLAKRLSKDKPAAAVHHLTSEAERTCYDWVRGKFDPPSRAIVKLLYTDAVWTVLEYLMRDCKQPWWLATKRAQMDTCQIAKIFWQSEASIANRLPRILERARQDQEWNFDRIAH